jgi:hypothetical protein
MDIHFFGILARWRKNVSFPKKGAAQIFCRISKKTTFSCDSLYTFVLKFLSWHFFIAASAEVIFVFCRFFFARREEFSRIDFLKLWLRVGVGRRDGQGGQWRE